ncbi:MAG: hypothetical protein ACRD98_10010 [Nitrososphaera sp.]
MFSNENLGKALDSFGPRIDEWIKEIFGGVDALNLSRPQKELIQALTVETFLFNSLMSNEEIIAVLSDIIRNIAIKHSYGKSLDWGQRAELFKH